MTGQGSPASLTAEALAAGDDPGPCQVYEGTLDSAGVDDLLRDLELAATVFDIRVKSGATHHSETPQLTLAVLRGLLHQGAILAAQVHYDYQGQSWIDTLVPVRPSGQVVAVRLIRARLVRRPA